MSSDDHRLTAGALRRALAAHTLTELPALPDSSNHLPAGVLVPLVLSARPEAIAILRQPWLSRNAGEVAFPGGRPEPDDRDLQDTAVREAREELGLADADVVGRLSSIPLYRSDYRLEPWVAVVSDRVVPDPGEVAEVLRIDLLTVLAQPRIDAVAWQWGARTMLSPVFPLGPHLLYGGSAYVLLELLEVVAPLLGRAVPPREPGRFTWDQLLGHRPYAG